MRRYIFSCKLSVKSRSTRKLQTGRGKVSLEEFRALADKDNNMNNRPSMNDCVEEIDQENLDDDIFSIEDFEETEQISIK